MQAKQMVRALLFMLIVVLFAAGCSDDDGENGIVDGGSQILIYGRWAAVDEGDLLYMNFREDNMYEMLGEGEFGYRTFRTDIFFPTSNQIVLGLVDPFDVASTRESTSDLAAQVPTYGIWNYVVSNDTLTMWTLSDTVVAVGDAAAPSLDDWVPALTPTARYSLPHMTATDITYHDGYLWYGNGQESNHLYKIDPLTGSVVDSVPTRRSSWALEWVDDALWVGSGGAALARIDTSDGAITGSICCLAIPVLGMVWSDTTLYVGSSIPFDPSYTYSYVYKCDPVLLDVTDTIVLPVAVRGMTSLDNHLWCCSRPLIYEVAISHSGGQQEGQSCVGSYRIPGYKVQGITFDGSSLWAVSYYPDVALLKVTLPQ